MINNYGYPYGEYGGGYSRHDNFMPQYNQPQNLQMQGSVDERIWVQGQGAAEAYLVAPNSFVRLWDSSASRFYEKRTDVSGRPYMETFEYKRLGSEQPSGEVSTVEARNNVYDEKFASLESRIASLEAALKKEVKDDAYRKPHVVD